MFPIRESNIVYTILVLQIACSNQLRHHSPYILPFPVESQLITRIGVTITYLYAHIAFESSRARGTCSLHQFIIFGSFTNFSFLFSRSIVPNNIKVFSTFILGGYLVCCFEALCFPLDVSLISNLIKMCLLCHCMARPKLS